MVVVSEKKSDDLWMLHIPQFHVIYSGSTPFTPQQIKYLCIKAEIFSKFSDTPNIKGANCCILLGSYYSTGICTGQKSLYVIQD